MNWKRIGSVIAVVSSLIGAVYVMWPSPLRVDAVALQMGSMQVTVDDLGETRSHDRFLLSAPVAGRLERITLHDGDAIKNQQLISRIAPLPLSERERHELMARVDSAKAVQREAELRIRQSLDDLNLSQRELERMRKLERSGFIAPQGLEQAIYKEKTAVSALETARFHARAAAADVKVAESGLEALKLSQSGAQGWLVLRAPAAGRVLRINDASERVVAMGEPLMTIGDVMHLEVVIQLLSTEAVKVNVGMPVLIEGWGGDQILHAKVHQVETFAFTKISALGIEEKRVNVIAKLTDPPPQLGDGFRLKARIVIWEADNVLKVPVSSLFRCEQAWCVFAIESGHAKKRTIELGHRNLQEAEVTAGLKPGEWVVRYPGNALKDGIKVVR